MKKFLTKGIIFTLIFLTPILFIEKKLSGIPNSYTLKRDCVEKNLEKVDLLILGSSQANYGIDPKKFSENSCNLANSNQDIYYDSKLIDKYLKEAKSLKTVIWNISYFSLEFDLTTTDESWRKYFYYQHFQVPPKDGNIFDPGFFSRIIAYKPSIVRVFIEKGFNVNLPDKNTPSGWFKVEQNLYPFNESAGRERASLHTAQMHEKFKEDNLSILKSASLKLKNNNINLIFVTLPAADTYQKGVDPIKYKSMVSSMTSLSQELQIPYYNFFDSTVFERSDFADNSDHLNTDGVEKLTNLFIENRIK